MLTLDDQIGIRFREIMSGHAASGATDPKKGERAGRASQETFHFDLEMVIPSLRQFLEAPEHVAQVPGGVVSWRGQAKKATVAGGGRVVMYRQDPSKPKRGFFDFEFSFPDDQGRTVAAHGQKVLLDDGFLDAGGDLSTVFLTLERGGAVCGAGITRVQFFELLTQLQSLEVTGAKSAAERHEAMHRFFAFMNEELRRIYPYFPRLFR